MKVLVTCGPTWVAIDDVRVISNKSTGATGQAIAKAFHQAGAKVTVLEGPVTQPLAAKGIKVLKYRFFDELAALLKRECGKKPDVVIHAAAVSDFKPAKAAKGKIASGKNLILSLKPTPKLIDSIKKAAPQTCLVGFKLEPKVSVAAASKLARKLFTGSGCDVAVVNSVTKGYQGFILDADMNILAKANHKQAIAAALVRILR